MEERLLNPNQSGFRPSDSCINQLLSITHEMFEISDRNPPLEVRSFFLGIPKLLPKFGMKVCFISSSIWALQENFITFLEITYQIVPKDCFKWTSLILESSCSRCPKIQFWAHFFFLVNINDLTNKLKST